MHISASRYLYTAFRLLAWLSAAFANGKVWVGSDNQEHDGPSHNCTTIGACQNNSVESGKN